jgi:hypothetical protein
MAGKGKGLFRVFEFDWWVPEDGFRWVSGVDDSGLQPKGDNSIGHSYMPLRKHDSLFRVFADTEPTQDGCLAFANRFGGLLGADGRPESFRQWVLQVKKMRHAVRLWDWVREKNVAELRKKIRKGVLKIRNHKGVLTERPVYTYNAQPEDTLLDLTEVSGSIQIPDQWVDRIAPDDVTTPARFLVRFLVNNRLPDASLTMAPTPGSEGEVVLRLQTVPQSLLGAMWLQFAFAIDGDTEHRRCEACGNWFAIAPDTARPDRQYCSNACRSRAYRRRMERARELHAQGKKPAAIAKDLGTDGDTVKKWLKQKKG